MSYKIKCTYVAEGEPFTLGRKYDIYVNGGMFYIKNDYGRKTGYFKENNAFLIDTLLEALHAEHHSNFKPCITLNDEPEKDIKKEVHELLDKATELIYNNQEELNIKFDDFITLVRIKEDTK